MVALMSAGEVAFNVAPIAVASWSPTVTKMTSTTTDPLMTLTMTFSTPALAFAPVVQKVSNLWRKSTGSNVATSPATVNRVDVVTASRDPGKIGGGGVGGGIGAGKQGMQAAHRELRKHVYSLHHQLQRGWPSHTVLVQPAHSGLPHVNWLHHGAQ